MSSVPANLLRQFSRPVDTLFRAYEHLIVTQPGMTLMVPIELVSGALNQLIDLCPVPWLEATAILQVDYDGAQRLDLPAFTRMEQRQDSPFATPRVASFARDVVRTFLAQDGICVRGSGWRHRPLTLCEGGAACRVLISDSGIRLAFTPDFLDGVE